MASYLRTVAGSPSSNANSDSPANDLGKRLVKWGLIIGVPTAVCVAAYLVYRQQQEQAKKSASRRPPSAKSLNAAAAAATSTGKSSGDAISAPETRVKTRLALAIDLKNDGNTLYRDQKFHEAIEAYTSQ